MSVHDKKPEWRAIYAERHGLRLSKTIPICACALFGRRSCGVTSSRSECVPPNIDHAELWTKGGKPYSITFHPYQVEAYALVMWAALRELHVRIDAGSWYYPGATLLVELRRPRKGD